MLYLAVLLDLSSRQVSGWAMGTKPDQALVLEALHMALAQQPPPSGVIHHTDQGAQYTSGAYQQMLVQQGVTVSMSRRGHWYDNAVVESFFSPLKNAWVHTLSPFQVAIPNAFPPGSAPLFSLPAPQAAQVR